jgi:hypothetical protein
MSNDDIYTSFLLPYVLVDRGCFFVQGLLITDVDSFGGMQARNVIVFAHGRPVTLRNSLLRQEKTQNANKTRMKLKTLKGLCHEMDIC